MSQTYYRFQEIRFSNGCDEFGDALPGLGRLELRLLRFSVKKLTPKGVRLNIGCWVSNTSVKRYAWPTWEEAETSFRARKAKQIQIMQARIQQANEALLLLDAGKFRGTKEPLDGVVRNSF